MKNLNYFIYLPLLSFLLFTQCQSESYEKGTVEHIRQVTEAVDDAALVSAASNQGDWLTHGRSYQEDRYSSLTEINKETVKDLGLAWSLDLNVMRGIEATPVVVDGIMYLTGPWSVVWAIDLRKGEKIWEYDPEVPREYGEYACCDVINRGVALYKGSIFFGTIDGRLVSLDAATGELNWEKVTVDRSRKYTITGAPRIVKGKVLIGNGGAEYDARGYVGAYDAETGKEAWRFYTVPGDPSKPFENPILEKAAETWTGEWWTMGGGGTVWDAIVYDPELNLVYIGVGNGTPWDQMHRSPQGGDNLFLSSIVALNPDNGQYVWHFQTTPGDTWDYTSTQPMVLADLEIEGTMRKVIMQAPKNGFFYMLDRTNGKFISGKPYTAQNWAKGLDENGRPIEEEYARYKNPRENVIIAPGAIGGHNWQPMAFNRETKLMYIPAHTVSLAFSHEEENTFNKVNRGGSGSGWNVSYADKLYKPVNPKSANAPNPMAPYGRLVAYDPVAQKEVWGVDHKLTHWNGGVLTTKGGLVFQGDATGMLTAYDAANGTVLWQKDLKTGIIAPPITYQMDGKQYLSIAVGWGGITGLSRKFTKNVHPGRIYTFELGGQAELPAEMDAPLAKLTSLPSTGQPTQIGRGLTLYVKFCVQCHGDAFGAGGGAIPDLTHSSEGVFKNHKEIILGGALVSKGMPNFEGRLTENDVEDIGHFVKFVSASYRGGDDPMTVLTNLAGMQYLADTQVRKD
ncbi:MAG: PQQ-dependent dehydrogenase, methanol/ethanol family [Bacteroidota bacterium]